MCPSEKKCDVKSAIVEVNLETEPSEEQQQDFSQTKKCGMNLKTVDLLPSPKLVNEREVIVGKDGKEKELLLESVELNKKEKEAEDEESSSEDEDDNDEDLSDAKTTEKYLFDGKSNSVIVPPATVKDVIPEKFTLAFSMKHAEGTKEEQKEKQNILCETDDFNSKLISSKK
jgi:hypothetical protein